MNLQHLGGYEIEAPIGQGGMGSVYKGRDPRFDREVAIKVLHAQFQTDPSVVERFRSEAVIQAKLSHPHIVTVLDFVADAEVLAIVMEYVEGKALDRVIEESGPMESGRAVRLMSQVLAAMGYAHSKGLVHRDIKPSNIMIQEVGGQEFAKVMDFGIAKILGSEKLKTATGARMGTLAYMSPEHVRSPKHVDARSDIYSLGVVLYQMLTGSVPFDAGSEYELMKQIVEQAPPQLSAIPDPLGRVVGRAMHKRPDSRYTDCREMAADLAAKSSEPASLPAAPDVAGSIRQSQVRGRPSSDWWRLGAAGLIALGIGGLTLYGIAQSRAREQARIEQEDLRRGYEQRQEEARRELAAAREAKERALRQAEAARQNMERIAAASAQENRASSASEGRGQQTVDEFVGRFLSAANAATAEPMLELYADSVDYYAWGQTAREKIRIDKERYNRTWPERRFELVGAPEVRDAASETPSVTLQITFEVADARRSIGGAAEKTFTLQRQRGALLIIREREKIVRQARILRP